MDYERNDPHPDEAIVLLTKTWDDGEAEMIRQLLEMNGIPSQVVSSATHTVSPFTMDGLGEVRIFVAASCLDAARSILAERRRIGDETPTENGGDPPRDT